MKKKELVYTHTLLTLIYTYICMIITGKLSIMITSVMHVSENPKWAAYILCTCTHVWCMDVRFDVYRFSSSPLLATSETTINAVILMHNEREKRKRTEIAKFRRASCSSIIILSLFFSLFLSFFLDATRNKTKFTRSYCIRLEKCYNFATFAVRTDSSFSDDTKKQKFAPFFYIHVCTYI